MTKFLREFFFFLNLTSRKNILFFAFATISMVFLDFLGIAGVGGFSLLLVQGDNPEFARILQEYFFFTNLNERNVLFVSGSLLLLVFIFKTFSYFFLQRKVTQIATGIETSVSSALVQTYIKSPYESFMKKDRAFVESLLHRGDEIRVVIQTSMLLLSHSLVFFMISCFLVYLYPWVVFSLFVLLTFCFFLYFYYLKSKLERIQKDSIDGYTLFIRSLKNILLSFKEIKIYNRDNYFFDITVKSLQIKNRAKQQKEIYHLVPRYLVETVLMCFIVLTSFLFLYLKIPTDQILASLGVLAVSFTRLLPIISGLSKSLLNIKSCRLMFTHYYNEIREKREDIKPQNLSPYSYKKNNFKQITFKNIEYSYPPGHSSIFKDLSFKLKRNQSLGVIGDSGSGKSTFVDLLCGIIMPQKGEILVDDKSVYEDLGSWRNHFAYIPQNVLLLDDSICNNVVLGLTENEIDREKVKESLKLAELLDFVEALPKGIDTKIGENGMRISGGQRQRVALARAFYQEKDILILDEATSALDPVTEKKIFETLRKIKDKTLILISHNHETLQGCDKIYEVKNKKMQEVKLRSLVIRKEDSVVREDPLLV